MVNNVYELRVIYDSRKSFYGKANVIKTENRTILRSYSTNVAEIVYEGCTKRLVIYGFYSPTTTRHIKECARQGGFEVGSVSHMSKLYWYM